MDAYLLLVLRGPGTALSSLCFRFLRRFLQLLAPLPFHPFLGPSNGAVRVDVSGDEVAAGGRFANADSEV